MTVAAFIVLGSVWGVGDISVERQGNAGSVRRAEVELVHHLELVGGAPIPASGTRHIVVGARPAGEPEAAAFTSHARHVGDTVYLWGDDGGNYPGTLYAVYGFLQKRVGVDWAYPGEDGIVFESRVEIAFPDGFSDVFSPAYDIGRFRGGHLGRYINPKFDSRLPEGLKWAERDARRAARGIRDASSGTCPATR